MRSDDCARWPAPPRPAAGLTLEDVAHEQHAEGAVVVQWDHVEDVDGHDSDEHLWSREFSTGPENHRRRTQRVHTIGKI